jgi:hypothetical protein
MIGLLPEELRRQMKLLEIIAAGGIFQAEVLEKLVDCSSKTLKSDLNKITHYIDGLVIVRKGQKGKISVMRSQDFLEASIYQAVMEESLEISYLEKIFLSGYRKIEEISSEMYISESAAKRMIKRINHTLKHYGLKIAGGKIRAENPAAMTLFVARLLFEKYQLYENCFPAETCRSFQQIIQTFITENQLEIYWEKLGIREKNHFLIFMICRFLQIKNGVIALDRKEGYALEKTAAEIQKLLPRKHCFSAEMYARTMFEEEAAYFFLKIPLANEQLSTSISMQKLAGLIDKIGGDLGIACKHKAHILNNCFIFLKKKHLHYCFFYDQKEMFLKKIIKRHPVFFEALKNQLEKVYGEEKERSSFDFLVKHTLVELAANWEDLMLVLDHGLLAIECLLIMDGPQSQINYIHSVLRSQLGAFVKIHICSDYPSCLDQKTAKTVDFIITNLQLFPSEAAKTIFTVSAFPTEEEIKRIKDFCKHSNLHHQLEKISF